MLSKPNRITRSKDFSVIFKQGKRIKEGNLLLYVLPQKGGLVRVGVQISKKNVQKATARNRMRRVITETIREKIPAVKKGADMVVVVSGHPKKEDAEMLRRSMEKLLQRTGMLHD